MIPLQILWVNFVTGVTLSLPLAWERADGQLMRRSPRSRDQPLFGRDLLERCALVGAIMAASAIGLFLWQFDEVRPLADTDLALRKAQTMAVTTVVLYQVFYLFQCRSLVVSALRLDAANPTLYLGVGATLAMHSAFVYAPAMHRLFHSAPLGPTSGCCPPRPPRRWCRWSRSTSGSRGTAHRSSAPAEPACDRREDRSAAQRIAPLRMICRPISVQSDLGVIRRRKFACEGARSRVHA